MSIVSSVQNEQKLVDSPDVSRTSVPSNHRTTDSEQTASSNGGNGSLSGTETNYQNSTRDRFQGYESSKDFLYSLDETAHLIEPQSALKWSSAGEDNGFAPLNHPVSRIVLQHQSSQSNVTNQTQALTSTVQFDDELNNETPEAAEGWRKRLASKAAGAASQSRPGDQLAHKSQSSSSSSSMAKAKAKAADNEYDDSGSIKSLAEAQKALEDNLALQERLVWLHNTRLKPIISIRAGNRERNSTENALLEGADFIRDSSHTFGRAGSELAGHSNLILKTNTSHHKTDNNDDNSYNNNNHHHHHRLAGMSTTVARHDGKLRDGDNSVEQLHLRQPITSQGFNPMSSGAKSGVTANGRLAPALIPGHANSPIRPVGRRWPVSRGPAARGSAGSGNLLLIAAPSSLHSAPVTSVDGNPQTTLAVSRFSPREESTQSSSAAINSIPSDHLQQTPNESRSPVASGDSIRSDQQQPMYGDHGAEGSAVAEEDQQDQQSQDDDEEAEQQQDGFYQQQPSRLFVGSDHQLSGANQRRKQGHHVQAAAFRQQPVFRRANSKRNNGLSAATSSGKKIISTKAGGGKRTNKYAASNHAASLYDYPNQLTSSNQLHQSSSLSALAPAPTYHARVRQHQLSSSLSDDANSGPEESVEWMPSAADNLNYNNYYHTNPYAGAGYLATDNDRLAGGGGGRRQQTSSNRLTHPAAAAPAVGGTRMMAAPTTSRDFREETPSYQVVHIHTKDKKSYGKYLWPIVGGGLTMLMGFLIISNILLSIPLLAIGASSLFNKNNLGGSPLGGYYSQQLVPVYNLSALTTRAPSGRRRRRRRRKRDLGGAPSGRGWSGGPKCTREPLDWYAEKMAARLWLLARQL